VYGLGVPFVDPDCVLAVFAVGVIDRGCFLYVCALWAFNKCVFAFYYYFFGCDYFAVSCFHFCTFSLLMFTFR